MAGKYIGNANAATIEALHKILEVGALGNVLIVDAVRGNDTKAATDISIPYATITAAKTAATEGKTIIVYPGIYNEGNLAKDGINYFFMPGAKVIYTGSVTNTCIFSDNNVAMTLNVYGYGQFINNGTGGGNDVVHTEAIGTIFNIECVKMHSEINRAVGNDEATVTIRCKEISSGDGVIDTAGGTNNNAKTVIYADEIIGINNYVVEHDGGDVEIYCNKLISMSVNFETVTTASGSGTLLIDAQNIISAYNGLGQYNDLTTIRLKNIRFDCDGDDIADDSVRPEIITVENCLTTGNIPYLKGCGGLNYINRPRIEINYQGQLLTGYEPDELRINTGVIPSGVTELELSIPENYFFESAFLKDKTGDFSNEGYIAKIARLSMHNGNYLSTPGYVDLLYNFQVIESAGLLPQYYSTLYLHADGDDLAGLNVTVILKRISL